MPCHHLRNYSTTDSNWSVASCAARDHLYVPSLGDLLRLCRTVSHTRCPYFLGRQKFCAIMLQPSSGNARMFPTF